MIKAEIEAMDKDQVKSWAEQIWDKYITFDDMYSVMNYLREG